MKQPLKQIINIFLTLFILIFFFSSCQKKEVYPIIPEIELKDFIVKQNTDTLDSCIVFHISFKDGDGDIGFPDNDTANKSIHVYYYKKINGVFKLKVKPEDLFNFDVKIPMILPTGVKRAIKGDIEYSIDTYLDLPIVSKYDTVYFAFTLVDRVLNISNMIETPQIVLKREKK